MADIYEFPFKHTEEGRLTGTLERNADGSWHLECLLSDEVADTLADMADKRGLSIANKLGECIATQDFLMNKVDQGNSILLARPKQKKLGPFVTWQSYDYFEVKL